MSLVPVKEYTSAADMFAARRALRAQFYAKPAPVAEVVREPDPAPEPVPVRRAMRDFIPAKNSRLHMFWTDHECDVLRSMASEGKSARSIAVKIGRSPAAIMRKAGVMGVTVFMRPTQEFHTPIRGEEITSLYKLVVDQSRNSAHRVHGIIAVCAERSGVSVDAILGDCRNQHVVLARQQAMWLAAKETGLSYPSLGKIFNRDHTTVLAGVRRENARVGGSVRVNPADARKLARAGL